jgi:hypothetical protein
MGLERVWRPERENLAGEARAAASVIGANAIRDVKLEISEDRVFVSIDGVQGEVTSGQARQVREMLAEVAVQFIQDTTRQRAREQRMLEARATQRRLEADGDPESIARAGGGVA